jgi:virulence factor Mce-like protein
LITAAVVLAKAKWALAFVAIVFLGMGVPRWLDPAQTGTYSLRVPLQDASGLFVGSDVEIAGAKAGRVEDLQLHGATVLATISIDSAHAPVHHDATVDVRPKSLLGEKYIALDPGSKAQTLDSGATLPAASVTRSTELQDVFNTFDQPTRDKLQVVIDELGGGVAGQGAIQNQGIAAGSQDLTDLAAIADTLAQKDQELKDVLKSLSAVTTELAQSAQSGQLAALIQNTENLMRQLADQDAQIQRALVETNAALTRTGNALDGTGGNLASINQSLGLTVNYVNGTTGDLAQGMDVLLPHLGQFIAGVQEGPKVFGGYDSSGYATRIAVVAGTGTVGLPSQAPTGNPAVLPGDGINGILPQASSITAGNGAGDGLGSAIGFILNNSAPSGGGNP